MARKTPSRLDLRKQAEAAESKKSASNGKDGKKKKATTKVKKKTTRRTKAKVAERRRLMWGVFNSNMKEEARFPHSDLKSAEDKVEQLKAKSSKKLYFIQAIKEVINEPLPTAVEEEKKPVKKKKVKKKS